MKKLKEIILKWNGKNDMTEMIILPLSLQGEKYSTLFAIIFPPNFKTFLHFLSLIPFPLSLYFLFPFHEIFEKKHVM